MAASPPSSSLIPPSSSVSPAPPTSQPNATSDPPASSPPPLAVAAPPPSVPSPPPDSPAAPPPAPAVASPPPASNDAPPPASPSPPPPTPTSPPPSAPPPTPPLPPPPASFPPPASTPPPASSPPATVPPPPPVDPGSPPPSPATLPPKSSPQPPPSTAPPTAKPPESPSQQPPPSPVDSPPPVVSQSPPPPLVPETPPSDPSAPPNPTPSAPPPEKPTPSDPSAPPPKDQPPPVPSPPSPPPSNSSNGATPSTPSVLSPTGTIPPPLPSRTTPPGTPLTPSNSSSDFSPRGRSSAGGGGVKTGTVAAVVVVGLLVLSLVGVAAWFVKKKRRKNAGGYTTGFVMPSPFSSTQMSDSSNPRSPATAPLVYNSYGSHGFINSPPNQGLGNSKLLFTYEHLHQITNGFSSKDLLGEGGFGCVYKGSLPDGREVAVKQLKVGGGQGEREFTAEVETISRVHHRNLVSLVGYCIAQNQRLLVYDYVPNNTLHYHIHEGNTVMDWATRVKVAVGAAHGIAYLHEDCHPRIIHRDIKSSNILLDNNFEAQVSDFGLAKLTLDAATHVTTRVMGTFGYMAPEYASTGKLTDRSDVYSFGVVLLELITGRMPVDQSQPLGDESLVEWARPLLTHALDTGDFEGLPDPRLEKNYDERGLFRMIEAAAACVRHSASMRPKMGLVVRALDSLTESDLNNGIVPGRSELFSAPRSTEIRMFQRMAFGSQDYSIDFSRTSETSRDDL